MADQEEELTPLKQKLDEFGNFLSKVGWNGAKISKWNSCCRPSKQSEIQMVRNICFWFTEN